MCVIPDWCWCDGFHGCCPVLLKRVRKKKEKKGGICSLLSVLCLLGRFIFVFERFQYFFYYGKMGMMPVMKLIMVTPLMIFFYIAIAGFANIVLSNYLYGCLAFSYQ